MSLKKFLMIVLSLFSSITAIVMGTAFLIFLRWLETEKTTVVEPSSIIIGIAATVIAAMVGTAWICASWCSSEYRNQLNQFKHAMKEASDGNLEVQCPVETENEVGDLIKHFNKMMLIMKSSQDDLNFMRELLAENEETMRNTYNHMEYLAYHDTLTELPNKLAFYEKVEEVLRVNTEEKLQHGLIFIDLDNFKYINDTYGHEYGDIVLQQAAERLAGIIDKKRDAIARIGGDEFLIFAYDIGSEGQMDLWKKRIEEVFKKPFLLQNEEFWITMSVGCALYPEHGTSHCSLVRNADIAMYRAKQSGKNQFCIFDKTMELSEE